MVEQQPVDEITISNSRDDDMENNDDNNDIDDCDLTTLLRYKNTMNK